MTHDQTETSGSAPEHTPGRAAASTHYWMLVLGVVLASSVIGIYSRPSGLLAAFWPTNAILLGLFLRAPKMASPAGWAAAAAGYILADLIMGNSWLTATLLNLPNLISVAAALFLFSRTLASDRQLTTPGSLPRLVLIVTTASFVAGLVGGSLSSHLFDTAFGRAFADWMVSELVSYIVVLPAMLTAPAISSWMRRERRARAPEAATPNMVPLLCLLTAFLASVLIGGPGALAFPVMALLACALSYSLFATALLTLAFSLWSIVAVATGIVPLALDLHDPTILLSLRLGVASIALAPIAVASVMAARNNSLTELRHLAEHDPLTGLLNRRTFHQRVSEQLAQLASQQKPAAMLMIDIDHFKNINDTYGHAIGDQMLCMVAQRLQQCLRDTDPCGRVGGEEFSVFIPECTQDLLEEVTRRIQRTIAGAIVPLDGQQVVSVTLSIGGTLRNPASNDMDAMLLLADKALYAAKRGGRNQTRLM